MAVDIAEAASILGVPEGTIKRCIRQGKIPVREEKGSFVFRYTDLEKWAHAHKIHLKTGQQEDSSPEVLETIDLFQSSSTFSNFFEHFSIYHHELIERGELLRPRTDHRILAELEVMELLECDCPLVNPDMHLKDFIEVIKHSRRNYFAVVNPQTGNFEGLINLNDIRAYLFDTHLYATVLVGEIIDTEVTSVSPGDELVHIMELFEAKNTWSLPVVHNGKFLGLISKATILDLYRRELLVQGEI